MSLHEVRQGVDCVGRPLSSKSEEGDRRCSRLEFKEIHLIPRRRLCAYSLIVILHVLLSHRLHESSSYLIESPLLHK